MTAMYTRKKLTLQSTLLFFFGRMKVHWYKAVLLGSCSHSKIEVTAGAGYGTGQHGKLPQLNGVVLFLRKHFRNRLLARTFVLNLYEEQEGQKPRTQVEV